MANRAFWGVWSKDFSDSTMLGEFGKILQTVPYSAEFPGLTSLVVRAVEPSETPLVDIDLRANPIGADEWMAMVQEYASGDCIFEAQAYWDAWLYDVEKVRWQRSPQRLEIFCQGLEYDEGVWAQSGHFQAEIGFEHLFTGHAKMLGPNPGSPAAPQDAAEARFQMIMSVAENLREYHRKTQENIQKLMDWLRAIEQAIPVERWRLWSEGEENFEARVDEILAVR
jgi:hypothetical protein